MQAPCKKMVAAPAFADKTARSAEPDPKGNRKPRGNPNAYPRHTG